MDRETEVHGVLGEITCRAWRGIRAARPICVPSSGTDSCDSLTMEGIAGADAGTRGKNRKLGRTGGAYIRGTRLCWADVEGVVDAALRDEEAGAVRSKKNGRDDAPRVDENTGLYRTLTEKVDARTRTGDGVRGGKTGGVSYRKGGKTKERGEGPGGKALRRRR